MTAISTNPVLYWRFAEDESFTDAIAGKTVTNTRASNATEYNASRVLVTYANDTPRLKYDPATGECLGLISEEARTNFQVRSTALTDADGFWSSGASLATGGYASPDGLNTGVLLEPDNANGLQDNVRLTSPSATGVGTSTIYTYSWFVKPAETGWVYISWTNWTAGANGVYYDVINGVVGNSANWGATVLSAGMEGPDANGYYRCWQTFTGDGTDTSASHNIYLAESDGDPQVARNGAFSVYVWGPQSEAGAWMSSYIPTEASTVTRAVDLIQLLTAYEHTAQDGMGSFYVEAVGTPWIAETTTNDPCCLQMIGTSKFRSVAEAVNGNSGLWSRASADTGDGVVLSGGFPAGAQAGVTFKYAVRLAEDDCHHYLNGGAGNSDTTVDLQAGYSTHNFTFGNGFAGSYRWSAPIKAVAYWHPDDNLSDAELDGLTDGTLTIELSNEWDPETGYGGAYGTDGGEYDGTMLEWLMWHRKRLSSRRPKG